MQYQKIEKGFSLVEVLVVMGIVAILLSMTTYGLTVLNRNSRNTQRVEAVNQMKLKIEKFYMDNGRYPDPADFQYNSSTGTVKLCNGTDCKTIESKAAMLNPNSETDKFNTAFCYVKDTSTYRLGVQMEGTGDWKDVGTSQDACGSSDIIMVSTQDTSSSDQNQSDIVDELDIDIH